jgi:hypothetical protein
MVEKSGAPLREHDITDPYFISHECGTYDVNLKSDTAAMLCYRPAVAGAIVLARLHNTACHMTNITDSPLTLCAVLYFKTK